jgi:hypothetical protein
MQVDDLNGLELEALKDENARRLGDLQRQKVMLTGLHEHYLQSMLEYICGDGLDGVRFAHEKWVSEQIDIGVKKAAQMRLGIGGMN